MDKVNKKKQVSIISKAESKFQAYMKPHQHSKWTLDMCIALEKQQEKNITPHKAFKIFFAMPTQLLHHVGKCVLLEARAEM